MISYRGLVFDASVLIDYAMTDVAPLRLSDALGPGVVPASILEEVDQLDRAQCKALGLAVVYPNMEILVAAAEWDDPRLSYNDRIVALLAEHHSWTCFTNDGLLFRVCEERGISVRRGLRLMLDLISIQRLQPTAAIRIAEAIAATNPFITSAVLDEFRRAAQGG